MGTRLQQGDPLTWRAKQPVAFSARHAAVFLNRKNDHTCPTKEVSQAVTWDPPEVESLVDLASRGQDGVYVTLLDGVYRIATGGEPIISGDMCARRARASCHSIGHGESYSHSNVSHTYCHQRYVGRCVHDVPFLIFAGPQDLVTADQLKHHEVLGMGMIHQLRARIQSGDGGSGEAGQESAAQGPRLTTVTQIHMISGAFQGIALGVVQKDDVDEKH